MPFIYYGEEIGMQGAKPDEDIRKPMQWTADGGFSSGAPWRAYFEDYPTRNVVGQGAAPDSLLNHYRALIKTRNTHEALRSGEWLLVTAEPRPVYSYIRTSDEETILVLVNLSADPIENYS